MPRPRRLIDCPREPVGLSALEAASFLGVSENTLREAVERGLLPAPRELLGRVLWDADELSAAFRRLPRRGEIVETHALGGTDWTRPAA